MEQQRNFPAKYLHDIQRERERQQHNHLQNFWQESALPIKMRGIILMFAVQRPANFLYTLSKKSIRVEKH
jgi:hypothetical protein